MISRFYLKSRQCTWMSPEVSKWLVSGFRTYLRDLQPTYEGVIIHLLSAMDIQVPTTVYPFTFFSGLKSCDKKSGDLKGALKHNFLHSLKLTPENGWQRETRSFHFEARPLVSGVN